MFKLNFDTIKSKDYTFKAIYYKHFTAIKAKSYSPDP